MSIVCGTDFSPGADTAARAAARLAKRQDTGLYLVHVSDAAGSSAPPDSIERQLRLLAEGLVAGTGAQVETRVRTGTAHEGLAAAAVELRATLVVVAALGHREERPSWLTGSTAERLVQVSPVPVLVVRDGAWAERWTSGESPLRILVAMEPRSPVGRAALRFASRLARLGPAELGVLQVAWPFGEHARLGVAPPVPLDHLRPQIAEVLSRDLEAAGRELGAPTHTRFQVTHGLGRTEHVITDAALRDGCDLLVVGTHQRATVARLWQGSVSRGVLHSAPCSVVCVPRGRDDAEVVPRPSFRRVVVGTDLSPLANRALPFAQALVGAGTVHLVTVIHGSGFAEREQLRKQLLALLDATGSTHTVEVVAHADVAAGLCAAAERCGADAICLATHGRTGVIRVALGSQAQAVLERSRLPVLLVPPPRES